MKKTIKEAILYAHENNGKFISREDVEEYVYAEGFQNSVKNIQEIISEVWDEIK